MTDLSPAAQAVLDEVLYKMCAGESESYAQMIAAAALRAAADQARRTVVTGIPSTDWGKGWKQGAVGVDEGFLAIADELEGVNYGTYRCNLEIK